MPLIPETGMYGQPDGDMAYVNAFSERAYSLLESRHPELIEHVATFKVIEADLNTGKAVGAFVLTVDGSVIYIPVIAGDGELRPLLMLYCARSDKFLPLSKAWLNRVISEAPPTMGAPASQPPTLSHDVSMRNMVRPPNLIGRFAYAADESFVLKALGEGPDTMKVAYVNALKSDLKLLQHAVDVYGKDRIVEAVRKTAAEAKLPEEIVVFEGNAKNVDSTQFKSMFGSGSGQAYKELVATGVAVADNRKQSPKNSLAKLDTGGHYENIHEPGIYEVVSHDGTPTVVFALRNKGDYGTKGEGDPELMSWHAPGARGGSEARSPDVLMITGDLTRLDAETVLGRPMKPEALKGSALYKALFSGAKPKWPSAKDRGVFVYKRENGRWSYSKPVRITSVYDDGKAKHAVASCGSHYIRDPAVPVKTLRRPGGDEVCYVPEAVTFVSLDSPVHGQSFVSSPAVLQRLLASKMSARGAKRLKLLRVGDNAYSLDGMPSTTKGRAAKTLMQEKSLSKSAALAALSNVDTHGRLEAWVVPDGMKTANPYGGGMPGPQQQQMPQQGQMHQQGQMPQQGYGQGQENYLPVSYQDDMAVDPSLMHLVQQAQVNDPAVMDAAVIASLADVPELRELVLTYVPNIKVALDNIGRLLIAVWIHQDDVKERLGDSAFASLEDALVGTFRRVGEALLQLSDGADGLGVEE